MKLRVGVNPHWRRDTAVFLIPMIIATILLWIDNDTTQFLGGIILGVAVTNAWWTTYLAKGHTSFREGRNWSSKYETH